MVHRLLSVSIGAADSYPELLDSQKVEVSDVCVFVCVCVCVCVSYVFYVCAHYVHVWQKPVLCSFILTETTRKMISRHFFQKVTLTQWKQKVTLTHWKQR